MHPDKLKRRALIRLWEVQSYGFAQKEYLIPKTPETMIIKAYYALFHECLYRVIQEHKEPNSISRLLSQDSILTSIPKLGLLRSSIAREGLSWCGGTVVGGVSRVELTKYRGLNREKFGSKKCLQSDPM